MAFPLQIWATDWVNVTFPLLSRLRSRANSVSSSHSRWRNCYLNCVCESKEFQTHTKRGIKIKIKRRREMGRRWGLVVVVVAVLGVVMMRTPLGNQLGWDRSKHSALMKWLSDMTDRLGYWAIPAYVGVHTLTLALCLPYAVFFEAGASVLFGFLPALLCVFSAKILGASLSFWIGRLIFRSSSSAAKWTQRNKYFHLLSKGVERDGWRFVLLARFSPVPSYVINYALAATEVSFLVDFLLPTAIGCLPMILQNTSIGSLASTAVASASGSQRSQIWSYVFPLLGILSSILISLRIKKYSTGITASENSTSEDMHGITNDVDSTKKLS
ncbi:TVP38 TMEM64 family membrane slr0305 [Olea europaea subsp. europaea]|uniref:TVP38 TMEM64 family membrane slr0305 n=1 Tax=Olea europaea subsp. europaea TaxID=158383 RepID=A0A8S0T698_OLEEU|nr:TVP38 TMEM64 family membrane slr0305 [Olea europaea subsp. europaea]